MMTAEQTPEETVAALDDDMLADALCLKATLWTPEFYSALVSEGLRRKIIVEREDETTEDRVNRKLEQTAQAFLDMRRPHKKGG